jgi:hypothetical protein
MEPKALLASTQAHPAISLCEYSVSLVTNQTHIQPQCRTLLQSGKA